MTATIKREIEIVSSYDEAGERDVKILHKGEHVWADNIKIELTPDDTFVNVSLLLRKDSALTIKAIANLEITHGELQIIADYYGFELVSKTSPNFGGPSDLPCP